MRNVMCPCPHQFTGYYKYQMGQYTWTIVTLGLIVFQMKYILNNIFNGASMIVHSHNGCHCHREP